MVEVISSTTNEVACSFCPCPMQIREASENGWFESMRRSPLPRVASHVIREVSRLHDASRVRFQHMAVETVYGYWLPEIYADIVRGRLISIEDKVVSRFRAFAGDLASVPSARLDAELERVYVEGLKTFFQAHGHNIEPRSNYTVRFQEFVQSRKNWLADDDRLERVVRRLHIQQMPDIWDDQELAEKFETSFFEDLSLRFEGSKSWVVRALRDNLELEGRISAEGIRSALKERLASRSTTWNDDCWRDEEDDDDDDDDDDGEEEEEEE